VEAFWARRVYGTTGERIVLRVSAGDHPMGAAFAAAQVPPIDVEVLGTAPLETVELLRGTEVVYSHPLVQPAPGERPLLKVVWEGARTKWRGRPTRWDGALRLDAGRIISAQPFAFDDPEQGLVAQGEREVRWISTTNGDPDGLFLDLDIADDAPIIFQSKPATFAFFWAGLQAGPLVVDAGGVGQRVTASLVPRGERPWQARFSYRDPAPAAGVNAYWLRVIQRDGAMAWSSPIHVECRM